MGRAGELIDTIRDTATELAALDLTDVPAQQLGALLQQVEAARAIVDAAANTLLDRFDTDGAAAYDGLRSTNSWLRQRAHMTSATAARRVRTARALRHLPEIAHGFRTGRFSADQADLFARHHHPRTADAMAQDETTLAALADRLRPDDLARELRGWAELVDTDGAEPDPGHHDRSFTFVQTLDDTWTGRLDLSAADGLFLHHAVTAMADHLYRAHEAGHPTADDDTRSPGQRRADALVELVRRGCRADGAAERDVPKVRPASPPPVRRCGPNVTLYLTLDAADLEGGRGADTPSGQHLGPAGTDRLLCDSTLTRVVMDPIRSTVLDLDRSRRVVSPAQWSALCVRDRGCSFPGCCAPPDECQAHHVVHWRRGGPTNLQNLTLACHHHHALVHEGGWQVDMTTLGPRWSRPDGSSIARRPGWRHRHLEPVPDRARSPEPAIDIGDDVRLARERAYQLRRTA